MSQREQNVDTGRNTAGPASKASKSTQMVSDGGKGRWLRAGYGGTGPASNPDEGTPQDEVMGGGDRT